MDTKRIKLSRSRVATSKTGARGRKATKSVVQDLIDKRFATVPSYSNLRIFYHMSAVKQWTG